MATAEHAQTCVERRQSRGRRAEDRMAGENGLCPLHDASERWNEERWIEQQRKNEAYAKLIEALRAEIAGIKTYIAYGIGAMAMIQLFGPTVLKILKIGQ